VAPAYAAAVVVHGEAVDAREVPVAALGEAREEAARPAPVAAVRPRRDEGQLHAVSGNPRDELAELVRVLFGRHLAAATPRLVAHAPVAHAERLALAARRAKARQSSHPRRRVTIFDPLVEGFGREAAHVRGEVGPG